MKSLIVILTILAGISAQAEGIVCSEDARPVDGPLEQIKLEKLTGNGEYTLTHRYASSSRMNGTDKDTTVTLIDSLPCDRSATQKLVAYCFKRGLSGDDMNVGVEFTKVTKESAKYTAQYIEVIAYSKLIGGKNHRYSKQFKLKQCQAL